jgi:hypothetical protein
MLWSNSSALLATLSLPVATEFISLRWELFPAWSRGLPYCARARSVSELQPALAFAPNSYLDIAGSDSGATNA